MAHLPTPAASGGLVRAFEIFVDLVIATSLAWAIPLTLAVMAAIVRYLRG